MGCAGACEGAECESAVGPSSLVIQPGLEGKALDAQAVFEFHGEVHEFEGVEAEVVE